MRVNFEEYTKDTYKHVPNGYTEPMSVLYQIAELNNNSATSAAVDAWKLGFERAYRAAKAGKLDFQQR